MAKRVSREVELLYNKSTLSSNQQYEKEYDYAFKLIVIGDSGVGKTCFAKKVISDDFNDGYQTTVGFEFCSCLAKIDKKIVKLQIWDTCGMEIYRSIVENFYRNSSLAFIVYAIDDKDSFNNLSLWMENLRKSSKSDIKIFLLGTKKDKEKDRKVSFEEAKKFADDNNFDYFSEVSSKTGEGVKQALIEATDQLYQKLLENPESRCSSFSNPRGSFLSTNTKHTSKMKDKGCC